MSDLTEHEQAVVEWAVPLHTTVWRSLALIMGRQLTPGRASDLPPEFARLEWLLEGNRWLVVRKEIARRRRREQYKNTVPKQRKRKVTFRERRREYMRAYRAKRKQALEEKWLND